MATGTPIDTRYWFPPWGDKEPVTRIRERDGEVQKPWA